MEKQAKSGATTGSLLELKARESTIRVGGHARLNPANLKAAGLESSGPMRVRADGREILLTVVADGTVGRGEVVLRAPDLRRLRAKDGAAVTVSAHELIRDTVRRQARETGRAVKDARGRVKAARLRTTERIASAARGGTKKAPPKRKRGKHADPKRPKSKGPKTKRT